jgi:hypothetical protein
MPKEARRWGNATLLVFLALGAACLCGVLPAEADPRFGDSTWIAPAAMFDSLYTTNGPRVAPRDHERAWETALRTPFRVVFYPVRLVGIGLEAAASYAGPRFAPRAKPQVKSGLTVAPFVRVGAVNDVSLGAAATWVDSPIANSKLTLMGSWSTFNGRNARFSELFGDQRPVGLRLDANYDYKPNRRYYGIGNNTTEASLSYFLLTTTTAQAAVLFGVSPQRQVRLVGGYSSMSPGSGHHGSPLLEDVFDLSGVPYATQTTQELWYGLTSDFSRLDNSRAPSHGFDGRLDLRRAVGMRTSDPDYYEWRAELRAYVPLFARRRVIALRSVYSGVAPVSGTTTIMPFYRLPESRGLTHFAGYSTDRYRDQQLMLARAEYRWPLIHALDVLALYELGEVAPNAGSFTLRDAHISYGGGLRAGISDETAFRFELAGSHEGVHAYFGVGTEF